MKISSIKFKGAKYHDVAFGLYLECLPDGFYEKLGAVYLENGDIASNDIIKIT